MAPLFRKDRSTRAPVNLGPAPCIPSESGGSLLSLNMVEKLSLLSHSCFQSSNEPRWQGFFLILRKKDYWKSSLWSRRQGKFSPKDSCRGRLNRGAEPSRSPIFFFQLCFFFFSFSVFVFFPLSSCCPHPWIGKTLLIPRPK